MPADRRAEAAAGRHWLYLVPQPHAAGRYLFAARLAEKAFREGDRVCLFCDDREQATNLDAVLWSFRPDSFLPHELVGDGSVAPVAPLGLMWTEPAPRDWDTLLVLASRLPAQADRFRRLALVAQDDPKALQRARALYRQLRELGCEPQVHDTRPGRQKGP